MTSDPWETGVLDPAVHGRLVQDRQYYAELAGVPEEWLWEPLSAHVGEEELQWVRSYPKLHKKGVSGICYQGASGRELMRRMQALTGALCRNFVDARLRMVEDVVGESLSGLKTCSTLLIPNLYLGFEKPFPSVKAEVGSLLFTRAGADRQTVLYIKDYDEFEEVYGATIRNHVESTYLGLTI